MLRRSALVVGALLGAFHVWLLGNQLWSGQLAQPDVVLRWLVAAALVGGLVVLWRRGQPLVFSRQAVAVWLLAALLHGPALANDLDGFATPSLPEVVATLAQTIVGPALGLALLVLVAFGAARASRRLVGIARELARVAPAAPDPSAVPLLPRPPPLH